MKTLIFGSCRLLCQSLHRLCLLHHRHLQWYLSLHLCQHQHLLRTVQQTLLCHQNVFHLNGKGRRLEIVETKTNLLMKVMVKRTVKVNISPEVGQNIGRTSQTHTNLHYDPQVVLVEVTGIYRSHIVLLQGLVHHCEKGTWCMELQEIEECHIFTGVLEGLISLDDHFCITDYQVSLN